MIKFKNKQTNSVVSSVSSDAKETTRTYQPSYGIFGVDCCRCGVRGYCNADLYLHRGDVCPEYAYDDGRAKDPDDF